MVPPTYPPELATTGLLASEDTQGQLVCLPAVSSGDPSLGGGEHPWPRPACLGTKTGQLGCGLRSWFELGRIQYERVPPAVLTPTD